MMQTDVVECCLTSITASRILNHDSFNDHSGIMACIVWIVYIINTKRIIRFDYARKIIIDIFYTVQ